MRTDSVPEVLDPVRACACQAGWVGWGGQGGGRGGKKRGGVGAGGGERERVKIGGRGGNYSWVVTSRQSPHRVLSPRDGTNPQKERYRMQGWDGVTGREGVG